MTGSTTIVILGATGDLAQRNLVSALFDLWCKGQLPEDINIVESARSQYTNDRFYDLMWKAT